jgi:hypothetical protein
MKNKILSLLLSSVVFAAPLAAAPLADGGVEKLSYAWKLKGGLTWLARLAFPSSGRGTLETHEAGMVSSRLTINGGDSGSYYLYESQMDAQGTRTLTSRNAYAFGGDSRDERVAFDAANGVTHVQRTTDDGSETKLRKLESTTPQDVLTSIYYLRQHANEIQTAKQAKVFSGASGYDVLFEPARATTMRVGNVETRVRPFTIRPIGKDAKRFPGAVHVWLSDDDRHIPVRIDIEQRFGTVKLDLQTTEK